jgi:hypothetical protein
VCLAKKVARVVDSRIAPVSLDLLRGMRKNGLDLLATDCLDLICRVVVVRSAIEELLVIILDFGTWPLDCLTILATECRFYLFLLFSLLLNRGQVHVSFFPNRSIDRIAILNIENRSGTTCPRLILACLER